MNRQDRPDELRDRLLGDVPEARPGFWADLTNRLDSSDTDAAGPRLMGMNTNDTTNRPPARTRLLALAAGAAVVLGAGAVALRDTGDEVVGAASETTVEADGTTTTTEHQSTTGVSEPDPATTGSIDRCYGDFDADFGVSVRITDLADGEVRAAMHFGDGDTLDVFTGTRLSELEFDGAVSLVNRTEGSSFLGRAELWYDSASDLVMAEDLVLPAVGCDELPAGTFDGADAAFGSLTPVPSPEPSLPTGATCFGATDPASPFDGFARLDVDGAGEVDGRFASPAGEYALDARGAFASDVDIVVETARSQAGMAFEPIFEKWIVEDGGFRPADVVPNGAYEQIDCGALPADFDTIGSDAGASADDRLGDVLTVDFNAMQVEAIGCWFTDAATDRVVAFAGLDGVVVELDGAPRRLAATGEPTTLPFAVVSSYEADGLSVDVFAGEGEATSIESERFDGSVVMTLPDGEILTLDGFFDCGV